MIPITFYIKKISIEANVGHFESKLKEKFGLNISIKSDVYEVNCLLRQIYNILNPIPPDLIKDCGAKTIILRNDLGKNKPYYPNHGYFMGNQVALNVDIFYNPDLPDDFFDHHGYFVTRPQQTLIHELGHSYDQHHNDLSLQKNWLSLSDWSENFKPGLKRLIIDEKEAPKIVGEWFYNPEIEKEPGGGFTRFYAKRNPWDDFADSFAFYVADLKDKVPQRKKTYLDNLLGYYYV